MKLLHDGKTVLAVLDGDAEVAVWTDLTVFAGTPAMCRAEIERLGLTVGLAPAQLLAESDDDRLAFELLRQKAAINERLVGLKLSQKAVDAAALVVSPVLEAATVEDVKPEEPGKEEPPVEDEKP